jgi:hypothetical protein
MASLFRWLFAHQSGQPTGSLSPFSAFLIHPQPVQSIQTDDQSDISSTSTGTESSHPQAMKAMNNNHNNTHQGVDYEKEVGDEDPYLAFLLPAGYAQSHSAEDVRKFVMVQIMALVLATMHLALLGLGTLPSSFRTGQLVCVIALEIVALYLLLVKHDFLKAALLLASVINFATLFACLRYGLVPEIYVWLGWFGFSFPPLSVEQSLDVAG